MDDKYDISLNEGLRNGNKNNDPLLTELTKSYDLLKTRISLTADKLDFEASDQLKLSFDNIFNKKLFYEAIHSTRTHACSGVILERCKDFIDNILKSSTSIFFQYNRPNSSGKRKSFDQLRDWSNQLNSCIDIVRRDPNKWSDQIWLRREIIIEEISKDQVEKALSDSNEFKRLIKTNYHLIKIAKHFKSHAEALINPVLNDRDEFDRLIQTDLDVQETAKLFPNHEVFKAGNRYLALTKLQTKLQIRFFALISEKNNNNPASEFYKVPRKIISKIAEHVADEVLNPNETENEIIKVFSNFNRSSKK